MKSFIQIENSEHRFLIATSTIAAITKSGDGCIITLNTAIDGFNQITKAAVFDVPYEDIVSRLASDIVELKKRSDSGDAWLIA